MSDASGLFLESGMASISNRRFGFGLPWVLALAASSTTAAFATDEAPLAELAPLRWQHRIILVAGQVPDAAERLRAAQPAIDERDILWFVAHQGRLLSNYPRRMRDALLRRVHERYFSRSDARVFLIGKDGRLKASDQDLDLPTLFARIDAMPMRRREMETAE